MKCVLNNAYLSVVEADSVQIDRAITDPVPTCTMKLYDQASQLAVAEMQQLLVIDDKVIPNPAANLVLNPSLNPYTTSWSPTSYSGLAYSQNSGGGLIVTATNAATGADEVLQWKSAPRQATPGLTYCLSAYVQGSGTIAHLQAFIELLWYDIAGNYIGNASDFSSGNVSTALTRYSVTATIPANAYYVGVWLGVQPTNSTNSGVVTFTQVQLEPAWFPQLAYPTPWCGPSQTNCYQMPDGTWIRQYRKFAGFVTKVTYDNYRGTMRDITIEASGYAWLMGTRLTTNSYSNTYDSSIMSALASQYFKDAAGNNFFSTNHLTQGFQINSLDYNYDDIRTAYDNLCTDSGFYWTADAYQDLWYAAPGYYNQGIALVCDDSAEPDLVSTFPAYDFSAELDFTQPGNSILVIGANASTTQLTAQLTSGNNYSSLSVNALPATLLAGTSLTITDSHNAQTVTVSSQANQDDVTINVSGLTANATYKVGASVGIPQPVGRVLDPNSISAQGYGFEFERKVNDNNLTDVADCIQRAEIELAQYDYARWLYHLSANVELVPGEGVAVTSATDGLSATMLLIQKVSAKWLGVDETLTDVWEYQADLGAVNRDVTNTVVKLARETNKNPTGVPGVTQTRLYVKEPLGVREGYLPYQNEVLADNPQAYYRLDEQNGTTAVDSSQNGYIGTYSSTGVTYQEAGALANDPDYCVLFDGVAGEMSAPSGLNPGGWSAISVEAWVKLPSTPGADVVIFANSNPASSHKGFSLKITSGLDIVWLCGNGTTSGQVTS